MIFDSDVLIWHFRGNAKASRLVDRTVARSVSVITYMELLRGARDRREVLKIQRFLAELRLNVMPLSQAIGHRASIYIEEYGLKAGMEVADALIAATAVEADRVLVTGNRKHFQPVRDLEILTFRP